MPGEGGECFAGGGIPKPDGSIITPTGEGFSIRTEDDAPDNTRMPGEQGHLLVGGGIVEPNSDGSRNG